jgi:alkylated DNA nucleotide flippase Atl1
MDRFVAFVSRIPEGRVVSTSDLLLALGVNRAYYRTIPRWLKTAPSTLPIHRLVSSRGGLLTTHLPDQANQLQAEGVSITNGIVSAIYFWSSSYFYSAF